MLTSLASWVSLLLLAFAVSVDGFGVGVTYGIRQIRIPLRSVFVISICSGLVILLAMLIGSLIVEWIPAYLATAIGAIILIAIGIWALIQFRKNREGDDAEPKLHVHHANIAHPHSHAQRGIAQAQRHASDSTSHSNPHAQIGKKKLAAGIARQHVNRDNEPGHNEGSGDTEAIRILKHHRAVLTLEIKQWGIIIQILRTPSAADVDRSGTIQTSEAFLLGTALSLDAFGAGIGAALIGFPPLVTSVTIAASCGLFLWLGTRAGFRVARWRWGRPLTALPGIILISMGLLKLL